MGIHEETGNPYAPVHLSVADHSEPVTMLAAVDDDLRTLVRVCGHKDFRSVYASHGVASGTWYFEVVMRSGPEGSVVHIGWTTRRMDVETLFVIV